MILLSLIAPHQSKNRTKNWVVEAYRKFPFLVDMGVMMGIPKKKEKGGGKEEIFTLAT